MKMRKGKALNLNEQHFSVKVTEEVAVNFTMESLLQQLLLLIIRNNSSKKYCKDKHKCSTQEKDYFTNFKLLYM